MIIQITIIVYLTYLKQTRFLILEKRRNSFKNDIVFYKAMSFF